jgi:hypothetical protein
MAKPFFCQNSCITGAVDKSGPEMCATCEIFKLLPKVSSQTLGEDSPNLATLLLRPFSSAPFAFYSPSLYGSIPTPAARCILPCVLASLVTLMASLSFLISALKTLRCETTSIMESVKEMEITDRKDSPSRAGLPDGLFSNQKYQFGNILEVPMMGKCCYILFQFGIFHAHLGYFNAIWYILCSFATFCRVLVSFTSKKNLATVESSRENRK